MVIFAEPGAEINGQYYYDLLLMQKLLVVVHGIDGHLFVFQQDKHLHIAFTTRLSFCAVRHPSSSVLTCCQPTVLI